MPARQLERPLPVAIAVCTLGGLVLWAVSAIGPGSAEPLRAAQPALAGPHIAAPDEGASVLRAEIARLEASLKRTDRRLAELEANDSRTAGEQPQFEPAAAPAAERGFSDAERQAFVAEAFAREPDDSRWTPDAELGELLRGVMRADSTVVQVDCRSSLCRVETTHSDSEAQHAYVSALVMPDPRVTRPYQGALIEEGRPIGDGPAVRSIVYLVRPGHELPAMPN